jgi:hypothetical protein
MKRKEDAFASFYKGGGYSSELEDSESRKPKDEISVGKQFQFKVRINYNFVDSYRNLIHFLRKTNSARLLIEDQVVHNILFKIVHIVLEIEFQYPYFTRG